MRVSLRASKQGLEIVDRARSKKRWNKQAPVWHDKAFVSLSTLKRFWERKPILQQSFIDICTTVGVNWEEVVEKSENQDPQILSFPLLAPEFYIERPPLESICYQNLWQDGSLLRIKALRQMGKTLLLDKLLVQLVLKGFRMVNLSFKLAERKHFASLDKFLRWFCTMVTRDLQLPNQLDDYWEEEEAGSKANCTTYWEEYFLSAAESPLILALDDVDLLFPYPEIYEDIFALLRFWHERSKTRQLWKKLRLVVAYSTEVYIPLNINQSPFNVGVLIELPEFTPSQVQNFAKLHGLDWSMTQVQQMMAMVGGHPFLLELAFVHLKNHRDITLSQLLKSATTEAGIYSDHLRQHLLELREDQELALALKKVVNATGTFKLDPIQAYRLNRMGLVKLSDSAVKPSCQLYRQYFSSYLGDAE
jgi:hypothetical protein